MPPCRLPWRAALLGVAALLLAAAPAAAQKKKTIEIERTPARPALTVGADTNDANAYIAAGSLALRARPAEAAAHFYWASRLRPDLSQPLYGRWVAVRLGNINQVIEARRGKKLRSMDWSDSLLHRALMLDPLIHRNLERDLLIQTFAQYNVNVENAIADILRTNDAAPWFLTDIAYTDGRFGDARRWIDRAIEKEEEGVGRLRFLSDKAHIHYHLGHADSALAAFDRALEYARTQDAKKVDGWLVYASRTHIEAARARILMEQGKTDAAREAFGLALQEDLAHFPAHMFLAEMALAAKDTSAALAEGALAVEIAKENAAAHYGHATILLRLRKPMEAVAALQAAIQAEPLYVEPYFLYGRLAEASGDETLAKAQYGEFLAKAPKADERRAWVTQRMQTLASAATP